MKISKKVSSLIMSAVMVGALGVGSLADTTPTVTTDTQSGSVVGESTTPTTPIEKPKEEVPTVNKLSISRIAGKNRYDTAQKVGKVIYEKYNSKFVVIASGEIFADALTAGSLASEYNCPLYFTQKNSIPKETMMAINDTPFLTRVFIVGGKASVGFDEITGLPHKAVTRISGDDRLGTSTSVGGQIVERRSIVNQNTLDGTDVYAFYDGYNFPDALTATPFMYQVNMGKDLYIPLVPIMEKSSGNPLNLAGEYIFGGQSSVPVLIQEKLRFDGKNRYDTAIKVAKAYKDLLKKDLDTVVITSGENFADALSAGPLASSKNAAILLTESKSLNKDVKKYIEDTKTIKNVIIVGGESAVSSQVEKDLDSIVR